MLISVSSLNPQEVVHCGVIQCDERASVLAFGVDLEAPQVEASQIVHFHACTKHVGNACAYVFHKTNETASYDSGNAA